MNSYKKQRLGFVILIALFIIYSLANTVIQSRDVYRSNYKFEISKIKVARTGILQLYNNGEEVFLFSYRIYDNDGVVVGDLVYKESCSENLYILRKDEAGDYKKILTVKPTGIVPREWFCDK